MTSKSAILAAAVSSLLALTTTAFAADDSNSEKSYGVAKEGKNDSGRGPRKAARCQGPESGCARSITPRFSRGAQQSTGSRLTARISSARAEHIDGNWRAFAATTP